MVVNTKLGGYIQGDYQGVKTMTNTNRILNNYETSRAKSTRPKIKRIC